MKKFKILLVHSFYGSEAPSGENIVFENERDLLIEKEHEVFEYTAHGDWYRNRGLYGKLVAATSVVFNLSQYVKFKYHIWKIKPDIIHVHNTFPGISPAIFWAVGKKIPIVLTLHNYRIFCASGIPLRGDAPCTKCLDHKNPIFALRYKCYRNSVLYTIPLFLKILLHRKIGTWDNKISMYIALSSFQKKLVSKSGLPSKRVVVKSNFLKSKSKHIPHNKREDFVLFIGRLSEEKGIMIVIEAWRKMGENAPKLVVVGSGPLRSQVQQAHDAGLLHYVGNVTAQEALELNKRCRLLLFPSIWFEGFPMVLLESLSFGTPIVCSDIGSMPEIVNYGKAGVLIQPGSISSITESIESLYYDDKALDCLSQAAFMQYERHYSLEKNYESLCEIYTNITGGILNAENEI